MFPFRNVFLNQFHTLQERHDISTGPLRMSIDEQDKVCCAFNIKIQKLHSRLQEKDGVVIGEIESGSCSVSDQCLIVPSRTRIEMTNIYHEDNETKSCDHGQNVRLELKNIEEVRFVFLLFLIF